MRIVFGIDQLRIDANAIARTADAAFKEIAYTELAPDLLGIDRFVPNLLVDSLGNANTVRFRKCFEPRRNIDAVAVDILRLGDHIAQIDADPEADAFVGRDFEIPPAHAALHLDRAQHGFDDAREFSQHAVAGIFDDPAMVLGDLSIDQLVAVRF